MGLIKPSTSFIRNPEPLLVPAWTSVIVDPELLELFVYAAPCGIFDIEGTCPTMILQLWFRFIQCLIFEKRDKYDKFRLRMIFSRCVVVLIFKFQRSRFHPSVLGCTEYFFELSRFIQAQPHIIKMSLIYHDGADTIFSTQISRIRESDIQPFIQQIHTIVYLWFSGA